MITKLELIEYLKHTPENTNYNILRSGLYNGSNKEAVDEFIEVLSRGNLSLAALQPYLAKLYEDDKTISPDPLPPFSSGGGSVPKPLTYDYMPEGYPTKAMGTVTLLEEQEVAFYLAISNKGIYADEMLCNIAIAEGQTYTVNWDGTEYECVGFAFDSVPGIGNLSIMGSGDDTGEPFAYAYNASQAAGQFYTLDTSASHTISVKTTGEIVTSMAEEFLPVASEDNYGAVKKSEIVTSYKFDAQAPHDQMVEAITAFKTGNASIVWRGVKVINASYNSSDDTISVTFAEEPLRILTFSNNDGAYVKTLGSSTYKEVQGNAVRIVNDNDNNVTAVLTTEGIPGNTTLSVNVDKFSVLGEFSGHALVLHSSNPDSTKKFKITVDDSGALTATEIT